MTKKFNMTKRKLLLILLTVIILMTPVITNVYATNNTFSDVPTEHWAYAYIERLAEKGIINGYADGTFGPNDPIKRQHVAKIIARALELQVVDDAKPSFYDVPEDNEFTPYIAATENAKIFSGKPDGSFGWNENITRRQIANVIVRALNLKEGNITVDFADTNFDNDSDAKENIQILASNGIVKGYKESNQILFKPENQTTRAQFTKILSVAMAVSGVQKAEESQMQGNISIAEDLVSYLPKDVDGETTKTSLKTRLDNLKGKIFVEGAAALPSIEEIKAMDGPGLNKINAMIESANTRYEALPERTKADKSVASSKDSLIAKKKAVTESETSAASAFVTEASSLPSVDTITNMNLSELEATNTAVGSTRAKYVTLPNEAKINTNVISSEKSLITKENAIYNTYINKTSSGSETEVVTYSNYNQTLENQVSKQMRITSGYPQTDYRGGGWKDATETEIRFFLDPNNFTGDILGGGRVKTTSSNLDLRSGPGINHGIIGTVSNDELYPIIDEDQTRTWYQIKTKDKIGWVSKTYINYMSISQNSRFQFLDLSEPANVSDVYLNKFSTEKGVLSGQGANYKKASQTYSINEIYLLSHSFLETGNGKSQLASGMLVDKNGRIFDDNGRYINSRGMYVDVNGKLLKSGQAPVIAQGPYTTVYNVFGIGAVDSDPLMLGAQRAFNNVWTSIEKAVIGGSKFVSEDYVYNKHNQNTTYKMRWNPGNLNEATKQYATDIGWAYKQVNSMFNYYNQCSGYTLYFDIPVYKIDTKVISMLLTEEALEANINIVDQAEQETVDEDIIDTEEEKDIDINEPIIDSEGDDNRPTIDVEAEEELSKEASNFVEQMNQLPSVDDIQLMSIEELKDEAGLQSSINKVVEKYNELSNEEKMELITFKEYLDELKVAFDIAQVSANMVETLRADDSGGEGWLVNVRFDEITIQELDSLVIALYSGETQIGEKEATQANLSIDRTTDKSTVISSFNFNQIEDEYWEKNMDLLVGIPDRVVITFELDGETYTVVSIDINHIF